MTVVAFGAQCRTIEWLAEPPSGTSLLSVAPARTRVQLRLQLLKQQRSPTDPRSATEKPNQPQSTLICLPGHALSKASSVRALPFGRSSSSP